jgi:hypothetical protein
VSYGADQGLQFLAQITLAHVVSSGRLHPLQHDVHVIYGRTAPQGTLETEERSRLFGTGRSGAARRGDQSIDHRGGPSHVGSPPVGRTDQEGDFPRGPVREPGYSLYPHLHIPRVDPAVNPVGGVQVSDTGQYVTCEQECLCW